jgi:hypothetical protein
VVSEKTIRRALRTSQRRIRDRNVAARMAPGFFQEAVTGEPARRPATMARLSINALSVLV